MMTKAQVIEHLNERGVEVLSVRMRNGLPQATISWRDYPKLLAPVDARLFGGEYYLAQR